MSQERKKPLYQKEFEAREMVYFDYNNTEGTR